jgi:UDP-N-acetylglucosamine 2-epimerase
MRNICVVISSRASYSRVKSVLRSICLSKSLELQLIVTASALSTKYGAIISEIEEDGFDINVVIPTLVDTTQPSSAAKTTGLGIIELSTTFQNLTPELC